MPESPLRAAIVTVTPCQQNCSPVWCTKTVRGALVDVVMTDVDVIGRVVWKSGRL